MILAIAERIMNNGNTNQLVDETELYNPEEINAVAVARIIDIDKASLNNTLP
jgi:hypothetical protein